MLEFRAAAFWIDLVRGLSAKSRHLRFFSIAVIGFVRNSKASVDLNGEHLFGLEFQ
jgi:hypothetical protein